MFRLMFVGVLLAASIALPARADTYPSRPLRLIVGIAAGGGIDILARSITPRLGDGLGQTVVVDNRPGAGNLVAARLAASSPPDGYTLMLGTIASHGINPALQRNLGYDAVKDFTPIGMTATALNVLVVHPSLPAATVQEFVAYARANPGKLLYGSPGVGSSIHMTMELFKLKTGTNMVHVPYKGLVSTALVAGEVQASCANLASSLPQIQAEKMRALAVSSKARSPRLPRVPSFVELGIPMEVDVWYALFAPAKVPKGIAERLSGELTKTLQSAELTRRLDDLGFTARTSTPAELAEWVRKEIQRWSEVAKAASISVD